MESIQNGLTSGDEIFTLRMLVSMISLLSHTVSVVIIHPSAMFVCYLMSGLTEHDHMYPLLTELLRERLTRRLRPIVRIIDDHLPSSFEELPYELFASS